MMRNYVTLVEEALNRTHARSEELADIITTRTTTAADSLQSEIRKLEEVSDKQISTLARTLREQHEKIASSLADMLTQTTGDFGATAREMRSTAQEVVKDIEFARGELKRAILELPEETRANADAMRRVVADQITALSALADVVKRQSGLSSLSGPGIYLPPDDRGSSPGKTEGAPSAAPRKGTEGARERQEGSKGGNGQIRGRPVDELIATPSPQGSANLLPRLAEGSGGKARSGALPAGTQQLVDNLNAASRALIEAVEGKLPAELERRYATGEEHVFAQRLYQMRNNRLRKDVSQRYRNEQRLTVRVDNFLRLFETLLDTVADAPHGNEMIDACLASESGKVYIALAQASGRLGSA